MASTRAQEEFLAVTRKSQEAVITAVRTWAETVRTTTEKFAPVYDRLPKPPSFTVAFGDNFPGPGEAVASAYHLAEELLANQRRFAEDLLKVMTPLIPGRSQPELQVPAKRTVAVSEPKATVAVSEPKALVTVSQPKVPAVVSEPKAPAVPSTPKAPAAVSEPKAPAVPSTPKAPAAVSEPKAPAAASYAEGSGRVRRRAEERRRRRAQGSGCCSAEERGSREQHACQEQHAEEHDGPQHGREEHGIRCGSQERAEDHGGQLGP